MAGDDRNEPVDLGQQDLLRDVFARDRDAAFLVELDGLILGEAAERPAVPQIAGKLQREPRDGPVHGATIQTPEPQSETRRVGKEGCSTGRYRGSQDQKKK